MANIVVLGLQWGDEGKGKIVDMLAERYDVVARYQGGHNAGHTVKVGDQKFVLHLIPSGILHKGKQCVIGAGVVVDPQALLAEMEQLREQGIRDFEGRLFVSARAHLIMPYHRALERTREARRGAKKIGTTGRGIGPAYETKIARCGVVAADLLNEPLLREKVAYNLDYLQPVIGEVAEAAELNADRICRAYLDYGAALRPYLADCAVLLAQHMKAGKQILCEGAQGAMLDVDYGTYPYVTSSHTLAGGACTGLGLGPTRIGQVLGVIKAYTTRVGAGPFPTELFDADGETLRQRGDEYGATTGRPRRCGWFDALVGRAAVRLNGVDALAVMKLDILDSFPTIHICTGYRYRGELITELPMAPDGLSECEPVYEAHEGWQQPTEGLERYEDLPEPAQAYLARLAELVDAPIKLISTGPQRRQTIVVSSC
jgi:adenylosuccinate synthase